MIRVLSSLWTALVVVGVLLGGTFTWFSAYYWVIPGIVAFTIGSLLAFRIWKYARSARNALGLWTRRIVMIGGLLFTGLMVVILFLGTLLSVSLVQSLSYPSNQNAVNAGANMNTGLISNLGAFVIPFFLAFLAGEIYLVRHHHTVSRESKTFLG